MKSRHTRDLAQNHGQTHAVFYHPASTKSITVVCDAMWGRSGWFLHSSSLPTSEPTSVTDKRCAIMAKMGEGARALTYGNDCGHARLIYKGFKWLFLEEKKKKKQGEGIPARNSYLYAAPEYQHNGIPPTPISYTACCATLRISSSSISVCSVHGASRGSCTARKHLIHNSTTHKT